jgi:hypothetical protein
MAEGFQVRQMLQGPRFQAGGAIHETAARRHCGWRFHVSSCWVGEREGEREKVRIRAYGKNESFVFQTYTRSDAHHMLTITSVRRNWVLTYSQLFPQRQYFIPFHSKARQGKAKQDKKRKGKTWQDKTRHDKARHEKTRQGKTRQGEARQDKAKEHKTSHHKTWQDKTRKDKER